MNTVTISCVSEAVAPTAAIASWGAYRPITTRSAALNSSCRIPDSISGTEKTTILLNSGPRHMSIWYLFFAPAILSQSGQIH